MLTCTPDDRLIVILNKTLQVMDQSGGNVSIIPLPDGLTSWNPTRVSCNKEGKLIVTCKSSSLLQYFHAGADVGMYLYTYKAGEFKCQRIQSVK